MELVVQNLSGGQGVYIVPIDGVAVLLSPTLHDRALNERVGALRVVTPFAIRQVAREIAAGGLAGPEVAEAAATALVDEQRLSMMAHLELLLELLRQVEPRGAGWTPPDQRNPEQLGRRARAVLAALAPQRGRGGEAMMGVLEELATLYRAVGVGQQASRARLPQLMVMLEDLRHEMRAYLRECGVAGCPEAETVEASAALTLNAARSTLHDAHALLSNLPLLLQRWLNDPRSVGRQVARSEWLLDGWERICLLWRAADGRIDRKMTLSEMAALAPAIPREAADWVRAEVPLIHSIPLGRRSVVLGEDWRSGVTVADLVARNERLRAMSPSGPS